MSKKDNYETLKIKWYARLKKSGFNDIEDEEGRIKSWSMRFSLPNKVEEYKARVPYYELATRFLNEYLFDSEFDRIIWEYHANGLSVREIADTLKKVKIKKGKGRNAVWETIKRLDAIMKKMYKVTNQ